MKCKKCGAKIADDSKFCEYCGTKMTQKKSTKSLWILVIIVLCIFIVSIFIYFQNKIKPTEGLGRAENFNSARTKENKQNMGYKSTDSGLYYRFHTNNGGETPAIDDLIDITLACSVNDTTPILKPASNIMRMMESQYPTDIMEGIAMMHKGDSASFIVNIDSTFYYAFGVRELPKEFNSTDVMRFDIKLNDFYPESEYVNKMVESVKNNYPEETERAYAEMQQYFALNGVVASPTASGLYYVMTEEGNGEMPEKGDNVKVHYTGKLLDGTVFDSSVERGEPIEVPIGMGYVIPGWDEGIMLMSKGEKGVLYIPYYLGYGDKGAGSDIPPFANLIFEVELVDF